MKYNLLSHIVNRETLHTIPKQLWVNPLIMKSGPDHILGTPFTLVTVKFIHVPIMQKGGSNN